MFSSYRDSILQRYCGMILPLRMCLENHQPVLCYGLLIMLENIMHGFW